VLASHPDPRVRLAAAQSRRATPSALARHRY
jgi:hypothetical protein